MRRLLGLLVSVIALWMGLVGPGSAAATPTLPTTANTYETNHHSAHLEEGVCNRGLPASLFRVSAESADPWSSGPVARSPLDATGIPSDYMNRAALGHNGSLTARPGASVGVTAHGHSRAMDGDLLPFPARHVAANTADEELMLYRGVAGDHPGYNDALNGVAHPRGGSATAAEHNLGDTRSEFTSWTTDPEVAKGMSYPGGVVMRIPQSSVFGRLVQSPDLFDELEILIRGPVTGAEVVP